jgi:hypothetical protein
MLIVISGLIPMIKVRNSDFPTAFLGQNIGPSSNVKKALFFQISWGKIPNSVVIKLFVKIANESFFK